MLSTLEPIVIEFDGQTYEVKVAAYQSPTGIGLKADLSEIRRLLEELEA